MLEAPSFIVSRYVPSSCEHEAKWIYNTFRVMELSKGKRRLDDLAEISANKSSRCLDLISREETISNFDDLSLSSFDPQTDLSLSSSGPQTDLSLSFSDPHTNLSLSLSGPKAHLSLSPSGPQADLSLSPSGPQTDLSLSLSVHQTNPSNNDNSDADQINNENTDADQSDLSSLIIQIGHDNSINCLLRCSRSDYGSLSLMNRHFRDLIRSGELYRLRRQLGIVEHWIYFSCNLLEWEVFDPIHFKWMKLPRMITNECFMFTDKESLAVGTELLVFGRDFFSFVIYKYSLLTHSWSVGTGMNSPRCLFGSASLGEIAIIAGGCGPTGIIVSSAELYNSDTDTWVPIPSMHRARKMCSAVFMDRKFYVIGGIGVENMDQLTSGEVYDLDKETWTEIPDMFPPLEGQGVSAQGKAPPLVAVVNNELYAANHARNDLMKYDKFRNRWDTVGKLPDRAASVLGWGVAFRACGESLVVIGGPASSVGGYIEVNAWVPNQGQQEWRRLGWKHSVSFVYNCAVMGC